MNTRQERENKIIQMAPVVRVFSVLFITIAFFQFFPYQEGAAPWTLFGIVFLLIAIYISTFGLEYVRASITRAKPFQVSYMDFVTVSASFLLLTALLIWTGGNESSYKIAFLPTILFYTVRFGLLWGLFSSGVVAFILAGLNIFAVLNGQEIIVELDIIYTGVFFVTAWLVGTMVDMERAISDRLSRQVIVDDLTGLFNHRHLQEELGQRIQQSPEAPFGFILADLDFFKHYNETWSHQAGDQLLVAVAETITKTVGKEGKVFRFGSDEFAVIIDDPERHAVISMAEKIRLRIKENFNDASTDPFWKFNLTISSGLAFYPDDAVTREELLKKADQALYKAKVISGNKVECYFSVLEQLAPQIAGSEKDLFDRLKTFLAIINARDRYTFGHSERVLIYCSIIASLMELAPDQKKALQYGAYLHDIGKIDIDRIILNKAGALDPDEWIVMKNHPIWGAEITKQVKVLDPAVPIILYHHERYDGAGYPTGLAEENIPIEARVLTLADAFDAMTVERSYKKARSYEEAILELQQNKSTHFDPDIVSLFVSFLQKYDNLQEILALGTQELFLT